MKIACTVNTLAISNWRYFFRSNTYAIFVAKEATRTQTKCKLFNPFWPSFGADKFPNWIFCFYSNYVVTIHFPPWVRPHVWFSNKTRVGMYWSCQSKPITVRCYPWRSTSTQPLQFCLNKWKPSKDIRENRQINFPLPLITVWHTHKNQAKILRSGFAIIGLEDF